jgi:hypothetical protein
MVHSIRRWVLSISCLGLGACGSDASSEPAAAAPEPAAAARAVFDLEATMTALVATLERRTELCRLALRDPDAFGRNEADEFVDAQYEEYGLVRSIRVQMESESTWTPRICEWFDAVLRKPNEENVVIESKAFGRDSDRFDWNDVVRIYGDEYASRPVEDRTNLSYQMLRRSMQRFDGAHPNDRFEDFRLVSDLYIFCVKMRMIEK